MKALFVKLKESVISVLPIMIIVLILGLFVTPLSTDTIISFLISCVLLIVGMSLFTLGADTAMFPIGQHLGGYLSKSNKLWFMILCVFVLGIIITVAEPDLTVLASQVSSVNYWVFIITVSLGVGAFLVLGLLRTVLKWNFSVVISISYIIIFIIAIFVEQGIIPVSFDSGSVTTGPISVPFIMALGVGLASVRGSGSKEDSFGMVGFASAGPILAVMILMWVLGVGDATPAQSEGMNFLQAFPVYLKDVLIIILPIAVFFAIFQIFALKLPKKQIFKIVMGLLYTYFGIVIFLVGVNVGFLPVGKQIGSMLGQNLAGWLVPICGVIGFCMAFCEPAVQVLAKQIGEITSGMVKRKTMLLCISIGVCIALMLCAVRALTHISILWILVPAYALAIILSFIAPKLFVGIAFDSGGVATGAMATTFAMPLIMGAVSSLGGNMMLEAFGTLAFCAIAPILVVLIFGTIYKIALKKHKEDENLDGIKRIQIIEYD